MKKINRIFFQILALAMILSSAVSSAFAQGGCISAYMVHKESCSPGHDGVAAVDLPAGLNSKSTIEWKKGGEVVSTSAIASGLTSGSYSVTVKSNACPSVVFYTGSVSITKDDACFVTVTITGPSSVSGDCNEIPEVTFVANASGGTPPYTFAGGWEQNGNVAFKTIRPGEGHFSVSCIVHDDEGNYGWDNLDGYAKKEECSQDPNEIKGPAGYDEERHFVNKTDKMNYTIEFENDPEFAMAPASRVKITYDVPENQKIASFRLADFGFGSFLFTVPSNVSSYSQRLDVSDSLGVWVDVTAGIDIINHQLFWIFQSIDPATGAEPSSSQMGFLPINDEQEHGMGYVSFYISPESSVQTGDTVGAEALIVFDDNAPIGTNVWTNTFDVIAPTSTLHAEMNELDSLYCTFSFEAQDDPNGSGVQSVEVYVSANNADYFTIGSAHPDSTLSYVLENGVYYQFMSIATDNVGNREAFKAQPDTAINYNTAPIDLVLNGNSFYEYDPVNTLIGTLLTLDNDMNLPFVYELVAGEGDDDNSLFTIEGNTLRTNATFVCSRQTEYSVRIRTTDIGGLSFEKSFDLNEIIQHVTPITRLNMEICDGSSIDFYGRTLTEAGTYTDTLTTADGCDSIIIWYLKVNPSYNVTLDTTVCAQFVWNDSTYTQSGLISHTYTLATGCDSTVNYNLTVNPVYDVTDEMTICASELPYTWNGVEFTEAGIQTASLTTVNGCDSVVTMTLIVNPIYSETDSRTICASELPYTWNGVEFTEAGTQNATLPTVDGCDSVVTMTLIVNPIYAETETRTICASELPITWNGVEFTAAGTETVTLSTVNGCDSVVTMTLIVNPIYSETDTKAVCTNELPITWNGVEFTEAGTQTATLTTVDGCDSVVTMTLTVNPIYSETDSRTICASELPYTWNGVEFTEAGTQVATLPTVNGCDSVVTMTLIVNPIYSESETRIICASELPITWNGVEFTEAGTQTVTLPTVDGCDSVVTMTLTVNPIYSETDTKSICINELPITWNGVEFTEAGTQTVTLPTVDGCDSVVTMTLTVNPIYSVTDAKAICASELPYIWNGVTFTEAGTQVATLPTIDGCDSVVTMTLTVNPIYSETDSRTICASELPYTWNGVEFTQAGTQVATLPTVNGCDSVVTMTLIVNPIYSESETRIICASELPITWNGVEFTEAGTQAVTLPTVDGCDSVVTMTLIVNPIYSETDTKSICINELPYTWNGVEFTEAGTQTVTLPTVDGCDSVVTMTLTVNPIYSVTDAKTICASELPYTWNGVEFTQAGTQVATLPTVNGCDSVVTMTLTVNPIYSETESRTICASELPITWNGVEFTQAGTQVVTLPTVNGCDSVVTMTLIVNPIYSETDSRTICANELPITWNGVEFTQAGTQVVTLPTVNGCDSVVTMTLIVNPIYSENDSRTICASELPYTWNGVEFTQAGTQVATLPTVNGCDSVVTMTLIVNPIYSESDSRTICASELPYTWNGVEFTQTGTQIATLPTVNGCDSVVTMTLTVNPIYSETETRTICANELPITWNGVEFTQAGTQVVTLPTVNGCDSVVTMTLIVNPIYSETETRTICASELPYTWNGVTFTEAGTQAATLPTVDGCDSVVSMTLIVNPIYSETETRTICASELPYTWNGVTFTQAGTQVVTLPTVSGCDSVITMTLIVNQPTTGIDEQEACDAFAWIDGTVYTESTNTPTYTYVGGAANGCDSIVTLHLTIHESVTIDAYLTINESDLPYTYGDTTFEPGTVQTGDYIFNLTTVDGCDSIIVLHLTVLTAIDGHAMTSSMNVYPNPTTDKVNVQLTVNNESLNDGEIRLYDMYGKWLRTVKVEGKVTELDLSSFAAGVYFVKAIEGQQLIGVRKIVKE